MTLPPLSPHSLRPLPLLATLRENSDWTLQAVPGRETDPAHQLLPQDCPRIPDPCWVLLDVRPPSGQNPAITLSSRTPATALSLSLISKVCPQATWGTPALAQQGPQSLLLPSHYQCQRPSFAMSYCFRLRAVGEDGKWGAVQVNQASPRCQHPVKGQAENELHNLPLAVLRDRIHWVY